MYKKFKIVKISSDYCNYLRKFDYKVPYNHIGKELRSFIGILLEINNCEYFAPFSSPKVKHNKMKNTIDLIKINNGIYGIVNINNMIPVTNKYYEAFDLNNALLNKEDAMRIH